MKENRVIEIYGAVSDLTGQMLLAARAGEWERLSTLESDCAGLVQQLKDDESAVTLNAKQREQKVEMIHKILANDRAIRTITEPWMDHLSQLLNSSSKQRKLNNSYGTAPPL